MIRGSNCIVYEKRCERMRLRDWAYYLECKGDVLAADPVWMAAHHHALCGNAECDACYWDSQLSDPVTSHRGWQVSARRSYERDVRAGLMHTHVVLVSMPTLEDMPGLAQIGAPILP